MKRILCYAAAVLFTMSCRLSDTEIRPVTVQSLEDYGTALFAEHICVPLNIAELVTAFDAYLRLSPEEKEKDSRFYEKIVLLEENVYSVPHDKRGYIQCCIDTGGKTLDSGKWRVTDLYVRVEEEVQGLRLNYAFTYFGDEFVAEMVDGSLHLYKASGNYGGMRKSIDFSVSPAGDVEGGYLIRSAGNEVSEYGFRCEASTDGPMIMTLKDGNFGMAYEGTFGFSTFDKRGGKELDWCRIVMKPGFLTKFEFSR